MRLFTAIELPPPLQDAVAAYARAARAVLPDGVLRWVPPENLHLTLVFLGEVNAVDLPALIERLDRLAAVTPIARLEVGGSGRFHAAAWVGVQGDVRALASFASALSGALGRTEARPLHPHVTVGRFRDPRRSRRLRLPPCGPLGTFEAREVTLFRSDTLPEGARYTALHRSALGRA